MHRFDVRLHVMQRTV